MARFLKLIMLGSAAFAPLSIADAQQQRVHDQQGDWKSVAANSDLSVLPSMPGGRSTILGGAIRNVDPVLDQFTLRVFGQRPVKIFFDERTQVFRNGSRIPLRELHAEEHASVQTVLDRGSIFAITIHMLSETPEGECQGRVLTYNPESHELTVGSSLTRVPIKLVIDEGTPIVREGQSAFKSAAGGPSDLVNGALVVVKFEADAKGRAVARHVTVLARPGSDFVFSGKVSSLDMHSGLLVLEDPRDQRTYQISFDPARTPAVGNLHMGDQVRVIASFEGARYTATEITKNQADQDPRP